MNNKHALDLLINLLKIPTVNGEGNEKVLATFISDYFHIYGIRCEIDCFDNGLANVIARIDGEDKNRFIVLNGHLDTVPYGDQSQWINPPWIPVVSENRVYCRGASDMKSGLAAMIYALCSLIEEGKKPKRTILFIGTSDEEKNGKGATRIVNQKILESAESLIVGEPTGNAIGLLQKGCLWLELKVKGRTSHGAYPSEGLNAVELGFDFCNLLKNKLTSYTMEYLGPSTLSINQVIGGIAHNMVPDDASFLLDIRMTPSLSIETIIKLFEEISKNMEIQYNGLSLTYSIENNRIPINTPLENKEVIAFRHCMENESNIIGLNFFSDASILTYKLPKLPVILFGPGKPSLAHQANEYCLIDDYYNAIQVLRRYISYIN